MRTCPSCQFLVDDTAAICQLCGAEIRPAASQAAPLGTPAGGFAGQPPGWPPGPPQPPPRSTARKILVVVGGIVGVIIGLIAGTVLVGAVLGDSPDPDQFDGFDLVDNDALAELEAGEPGEWQIFESADPGFRLELPGKAVVEVLPVTVDLPGDDPQMATVGSERLSHAVSWVRDSGSMGLDGAVTGAAANVGGSIVRSEPTELAGMDARRATIDAGQFVYLTVIAGDGVDFYQLIVVADPSIESAANDDLDRMIETFALTP